MSYSGMQLVHTFNSVQPADQSRPDVRMGSLLSPTPPPPLHPCSPISHTLAVTRSTFTAPKVTRLPHHLTDRVPCQPSFSDFDRSHLFKRAKVRQPLGRWLSGPNRTKISSKYPKGWAPDARTVPAALFATHAAIAVYGTVFDDQRGHPRALATARDHS
ncbi:hypothetical protein GY45DRAFT_4041 [Cubamyces sp. BRFM 1775]|nr:hypothetical protein GY45DRAFT_4041 [Cubamyces sp. BRFM 1775]